MDFPRHIKSGIVTTDGNGEFNLVFNTPFEQDNYSVGLTCERNDTQPLVIVHYSNKTVNGFTIVTQGVPNGHSVGNVEVSWRAATHCDI